MILNIMDKKTMKGKKKMFLKFKLRLLRASAFPRRKDILKKRK